MGMLRVRLHETTRRKTCPNRQISLAGAQSTYERLRAVTALVSRIEHTASRIYRSPERIGFERDYEHEQEYEFGRTTHLRIMMRRFVC